MNLVEVDGLKEVEYVSKSGNTRLKWRRVFRDLGVLKGVASPYALRNMLFAGINVNILSLQRLRMREEVGQVA